MRYLWVLLVVMVLVSGCATFGPVVSKSSIGNLEINVYTADMKPNYDASLYLDGVFVGNLSKTMPVLYARRGTRVVRVECPGYQPYEKTITILGDPNHQVLNVVLTKP